MNRTQRITRRHTMLVLAGAATAALPLSAIAVAAASHQDVAADKGRVPATVVRIIVEQLSVLEAQVTWDARFVDDLGADSLETVKLTLAFEEEFKIDIPDEVAERLLRVGDVVEYLRKLQVLK